MKACVHCGHSGQFKGIIKRPVLVHFDENGGIVLDQEGKKYIIEIIECGGCKTKITEADLIEGAKCSKCGQIAILDANGVCPVCARPDLGNLTQLDYIRKIIELEKRLNGTNEARIDAKIETSIHQAEENENVAKEDDQIVKDQQEKKTRAKKSPPKEDIIDAEQTTKAAVEENPIDALVGQEQQASPLPPVQPDNIPF